MASTYALPLNGGSHTQSDHGHTHSHSNSNSNSHSHSHHGSAWLNQINGAAAKRNSSSVSLNSQIQSEKQIEQGETGAPVSEMLSNRLEGRPSKPRARGPTTLGRSREPSPLRNMQVQTISPAAIELQWPASAGIIRSHLPAQEALTAVFISLPYLFASLAYPTSPNVAASQEPSPIERLVDPIAAEGGPPTSVSAFLQACCLTSGTLLLVGFIGTFCPPRSALDRRKSHGELGDQTKALLQTGSGSGSIQRAVMRTLSIGLPYYAAMQLGGPRASFVLLTAMGSGFNGLSVAGRDDQRWMAWKQAAVGRKATIAVLLISLLLDFSGLSYDHDALAMVKGHLALALSVLFFPVPLPVFETNYDPRIAGQTDFFSGDRSSSLTSTFDDIKTTIHGGLLTGFIAVAYSIFSSISPSLSSTAITFTTLSMAASLGMVFLAAPATLTSPRRLGVALGYIVTIIFGFILHSDAWKGFMALGVLSGLAYVAVAMDTTSSAPSIPSLITPSRTEHSTHHQRHAHTHVHGKHSKLTAYLLTQCPPGSITHSVLLEKDSRRIAYFGCLNLAFMAVQFFYGFISGSLGLLADSIHMLFDCAGLAVGLAAAVMAKWPPSQRYPYGYGKIDTLSGFANGIFLMLISIEFIFDSVEKLQHGHEMQRLNELLVVSVMGLVVNLVGLTAFGHAHHGHDHGGGDHGHSHDNENMHGIFLHVLADALGSVAVIASTIAAQYTGWAGWDPIASFVIAVLILISAWPLVKSSGMRLLLSLPSDVEYKVRNVLQELSSMRGVAGYTVPKFWLEDAGAAHAHAHEHAHEHEHDCNGTAHSHDHSYEHGHDHSHSHSHSHVDHSHDGHSHEHAHGHSHSHSTHSAHSAHSDHDQRPHSSHSHGSSHSHDHGHNHKHDHGHFHGHDHDHDHDHGAPPRILGVIHVIAAPIADLEDVHQRCSSFFAEHSMDVLVQVEREGEGNCWCGGGVKR